MFDKIKAFFKSVSGTQHETPPDNYPLNWWQQDFKPSGLYSSKHCGTVGACVDAYAQTIALLPINLYKIQPDGSRARVFNSNFKKVLNKPNFYQTKSEFFLNLIVQLMRTGNANAIATRKPNNDINQLHILPSTQVIPYIANDLTDDKENKEKTIFYGVGGNILINGFDYLVPQRDVLSIRLYSDPQNPLKGISPITNASLAIATNTSISENQKAFFNNMSRPSGFLSVSKETPEDAPLTNAQIKQLRESWKQQSVLINSGGIPVINGNVKWHSLALTSQDAGIVSAFKMSVEEIARIYRVPLPLIGVYENSTYNNVEQLISSWLATGLGFVIEHVEQALHDFFNLSDEFAVEFDVENLLRMDFQGKIKALTDGILGGLFSPNEARARFNLRSVAFGDEPRVQMQVVPLSYADAQNKINTESNQAEASKQAKQASEPTKKKGG